MQQLLPGYAGSMTDNCEQLKSQLVALRQHADNLYKSISDIGSSLGMMADRASSDDRYDNLSDKQDAMDVERDRVLAEIVEIESVMRNLNCG